jgi:hypothetical protein
MYPETFDLTPPFDKIFRMANSLRAGCHGTVAGRR